MAAAAPGSDSAPRGVTVNVNVGVLGHVDSGKTALCRALSTRLSTAALDKNPQSQERGITLDLGFSSFMLPAVPAAFRAVPRDPPVSAVQITLVDCPGHASLIRTIIGGAQIIDLMLLVVDATKGIQTQTAECLVIGEILSERMIVVINKVDRFPAETRDADIAKLKKRLSKTFASTKFGAEVPMVCVSAAPPEGPPAVGELVSALAERLEVPDRVTNNRGPFLMAVDHCFGIRGSGTVMTGTVLRGSVCVGQDIQVPDVGPDVVRKVKSMQIFKEPVSSASVGDRAAVCVGQLDPKLLERGLACEPGSVRSATAVIASVRKIRFYKGSCRTKDRVHLSIGHDTVMATVTFLAVPRTSLQQQQQQQPPPPPGSESFDFDRAYDYLVELADDLVAGDGKVGAPPLPAAAGAPDAGAGAVAGAGAEAEAGARGGGDGDGDGDERDEDKGGPRAPGTQFAVLEFDRPVSLPDGSRLIGSRLDADANANACRLVFHGRALCSIAWDAPAERARVRAFREKVRVGSAQRVMDDRNLIGSDMFSRNTDMRPFVGLRVVLESTGRVGVIQGSFGTSGKFKVFFADGHGLPGDAGDRPRSRILLKFRKYVFALDKKRMAQDY